MTIETETPQVVEPVKPSKLKRLKSNAVTAMWIAIPVAATGGLMYFGFKQTTMQLEAAKLTLEAAKLNKS